MTHAKKIPLTVMVAPAGSGKSTLLKQWEEDNAQLNVAHLDSADRYKDIFHVLKLILDSIRKTVQVFDAPVINLFSSDKTVSANDIAIKVTQVLRSIDDELYLVLDDYQNIESSYSSDLLNSLIESLPENIHIILSSRHYPRLNLSRLKIEDKLLQVDVNDLKFESQQVNELSKKLGGGDIEKEYLKDIMQTTEGWIAGIKIALMDFNQQGPNGITSFNGKQPDLVEYLKAEVYRKLPDNMQEFLLSTGILESFNALACNELLGISDAQSMIDVLLRQGMFVSAIDDRQGWYRYHSLLSDFLRHRLKETLSEIQVREKHELAGGIFSRNKDFENALYHFKKAQVKGIHSGIYNACEYWLKQGEFSKIIIQLDELSSSEFMSNINLLLIYIHALIFYRRFNQAKYFLELLPQDSILQLEVESTKNLAFLKLCLGLFQKETQALANFSCQELMAFDNNDGLRMFAGVFAAYYELQKGQIDNALRIAENTKTRLSTLDYVLAESYVDLIIALCERHVGRGVEAVSYISQINNKNNFIKGSLAWVNLKTAMVIVHYEQNQLSKARQWCETLLPLINHSCVTEVISTIYLSLSRLLFIEGDRKKASRVLLQFERLLIFGYYQRFASQCVQESMRQAWLSGDGSRANQLVSEHDLEKQSENIVLLEDHYNEVIERQVLTLGYWYVFKGEYKKAEILLKELVEKLDDCGAISRSLVAKANLLMLDAHQGNESIAIQRLVVLIESYGYLGFSRSIFDETPGLQTVFILANKSQKIQIPDLFLNVFDDLLKEEDIIKPSVNFQPIALTDKEQEVYILLASGLSNAEISQQSGTAVSTTKWHLKNIYGKLGVANRSEAIQLKQLTLQRA